MMAPKGEYQPRERGPRGWTTRPGGAESAGPAGGSAGPHDRHGRTQARAARLREENLRDEGREPDPGARGPASAAGARHRAYGTESWHLRHRVHFRRNARDAGVATRGRTHCVAPDPST